MFSINRATFPTFTELTLDPRGPPLNAWGLFDNELGMLNLLTPLTVTEAAKEIKDGTRIPLDLPLNKPLTPCFGRKRFEIKRFRREPKFVVDDVLGFNTQGGTQWDGLKHYAHQASARYYNGHSQEEVENTDVLGIDKIVAKGGIVGRGVLIDYASWAERNNISHSAFESTAIRFSDVKKIIAEEAIFFKPGDILIIRSGFGKAFEALTEEEQTAIATRESQDFIGLEATKEVLEWLWENKFAAVAGDAPAFEVAPTMGAHYDPDIGCLHENLLAGWGMLIGELFDLEDLAKKCIAAKRNTFFISSLPLHVPGGVASPPNAVAIF